MRGVHLKKESLNILKRLEWQLYTAGCCTIIDINYCGEHYNRDVLVHNPKPRKLNHKNFSLEIFQLYDMLQRTTSQLQFITYHSLIWNSGFTKECIFNARKYACLRNFLVDPAESLIGGVAILYNAIKLPQKHHGRLRYTKLHDRCNQYY